MGLGNSDYERGKSKSGKLCDIPSINDDKSQRTEERLSILYKEGVSLNDFQVLDSKIGEGAFAKVKKVRHIKSKKIYACKVMSKQQLLDERQVVNIFIERGILMRLQHPFVVSLWFAFQTDDNLYFVMDYCSGGDFFHYLQQKRKFSERITRFYAAEICLALEALHKSDMIHRDVKPENILLTKEGHLKLTDFGLSKWGGSRRKQELRAQTFLGSAPYLAPEVLDLKTKEYTKAVDWWAFGILIVEMLTGLPAFYENQSENNYKRILHESVPFKRYLSRQVRSIILDLLEKDPNERLKEADEVKQHEFFCNTDWNAFENLTVEIPPGVGPLSNLNDSSCDEGSSDAGCTSEQFKSTSRMRLDEEKDASRKIPGDPFLGFTYVGANKGASLLDAPAEDFDLFKVESEKMIIDISPQGVLDI